MPLGSLIPRSVNTHVLSKGLFVNDFALNLGGYYLTKWVELKSEETAG